MSSDVICAAERLVRVLRGAQQTVATAESLTAGLCAAHIASVPGASSVLRGGLIVYATELKHSLCGVDQALLSAEGPIHPEVARQLARGAAIRCGADVGIGLTGVAGPDPQDGHPVGEVYVGVALKGHTEVRSLREEFDQQFFDALVQREPDEQAVARLIRSEIRERAAAAALSLAADMLAR